MINKNRNRKGFTLVELLAVIVILALILAIAVPTIANIIENAKSNTIESEAKLLVRTLNLKIMDNSAFDITSINEGNLSTINVDGSNFESLKVSTLNGKPYVYIIGQNQWDDLIVCGTYDELYVEKVGSISACEFMGNAPALASGMIPVYYDEAGGVWKKADVNNVSNGWYDYRNFKWANAVTTTSTNRATYQSAAVGTTIPMTDINTMFVWIPRYKYRIASGTGQRLIDVVFEDSETAKSNGDAISTYYTHPAFTFGANELNGIWVGKFEMTGTVSALTIKPGEASVRNQTIKAMYDSIKNTMQGQTTYGFDNNNDIHMMKNEEWGAAAYLSGSKYGKYGNASYNSVVTKEVYMNNSVNYLTGRSMGAPGGGGIKTPTNEYNNNGYYTYDGKCATIYTSLTECATGTVGQAITTKTLAYGASTTGTIYGIYDMSGGAYESVMGMYKPAGLIWSTDFSGYTSPSGGYYPLNLLTIDSKYYYQYKSSTANTACNNDICKGHALSETDSWYSDGTVFPIQSALWVVRGSEYSKGAAAGIFSFNQDFGAAFPDQSFRATMAINNGPFVSFGLNGNSTYSNSYTTSVIVSPNKNVVDETSLKYQWTTSMSAPTEESFSTAFSSGDSINTPANLTGSYYLWILAKDNVGNASIVNSQAFNLDNSGPTITLNGANPATALINNSFTDLGATAYDINGGNRSVSVSGTVNTAVLGSYTLTYQATDTLGLTSILTRTVNVVSSLSLTYASNNRIPTLGTGGAGTYPPTGWTALLTNTNSDDDYYSVPLPFSIYMYGTAYNSVYVGTNSYITFGSGSTAYSSFSKSTPPYNKILFGADDNSAQNIHYYSSNLYTRIRYEGNGGTSGTMGSPGMVVEITLFNPAYVSGNKTMIEVLVGNHNRLTGGTLVANASGTSYQFYALSTNTSYIFVGDSSGNAMTVYAGNSVTNVNY